MPRNQTPRSASAPTESFEAWYRRRNPEFVVTAYQLTLIRRLEQLARREGRRKLAVTMPPGDGKSSIGTLNFAPWYLSQFPTHSVLGPVSYADALAKRFGGKVKRACEAEARDRYPGLTPTRDSRAKNYFTTEQGNEFHAAGFDGPIAGNRMDLVIIDDPVKNRSEAESEATMEERFDIYKSVIRNRLKPGGIMLMVLTRYGLRDFYARVIQAEPDQWDVLTFPAENADGTFLWEEYHGREHYELEKKDPETWWSVWMQEPRAFISRSFSPNWLMYYERGDPGSKTDPWRWATYAMCDAARGLGGKDANRTSMPIWAAGPERRVFLVDWVLDRLDPGQRADAVVRMIRKWQPARFIYEETSYNSDTFYLNERMEKEGISQRLIPVGRKGPRAHMSKGQKIEQLAEWFREGRIWLPKKLMYRQVDGHEVDLVKYFIEQEYIPYRGQDTIPFDDALDSFAMLNEPELRLEYLEAPGDAVRAEQEWGPRQHGTWEAIY